MDAAINGKWKVGKEMANCSSQNMTAKAAAVLCRAGQSHGFQPWSITSISNTST
jgi:hypothetical protein